MTNIPFKTDFAILDVTAHRKRLHNHIAKGNTVVVQITMEIEYPHGSDDGTSQEFSGVVTEHKVLNWSKK